MNFKEYDVNVAKTAIYPSRGSNIHYPTLGLGGEVGEIFEKLKKIARDKGGHMSTQDRKDLMHECGDVLWYLSTFLFELGYSLEEAAKANNKKLLDRQARGVIGGSGDNR